MPAACQCVCWWSCFVIIINIHSFIFLFFCSSRCFLFRIFRCFNSNDFYILISDNVTCNQRAEYTFLNSCTKKIEENRRNIRLFFTGFPTAHSCRSHCFECTRSAFYSVFLLFFVLLIQNHFSFQLEKLFHVIRCGATVVR